MSDTVKQTNVTEVTEKVVEQQSENKEMESNTSSNQSPKSTDPKTFYDLALTSFKNKEYIEAYAHLDDAIDLLNKKHPESDYYNVEYAEYFVLYGKACLRSFQSKNQIFGDFSSFDVEDDVEEDDEEPAPFEAVIEDKTEPKTETKLESSVEKNDTLPVETNDNTVKENNEQNDQPKDKQNDNLGEPEEKDDKEHPDLGDESEEELCWEYFEHARMTLEKFLKDNQITSTSNNNNNNNKPKISEEDIIKYTKLLSDVHTYLGEILLESNKTGESLAEYEKAIDVLKSLKSAKRDLASIHFLASLTATHHGDEEKIDYHKNQSELLLTDCIQELLQTNNCNLDEEKKDDFEYLEKSVKDFKTKFSVKKPKVCEELENLLMTLDDLVSRNDQEEENEKLNDDNFDMNVFRKALLEQGFEGFCKDDKVFETSQTNDNKENKDNNTIKQGVTTFGFGNTNKTNENEKINTISSSNIRSKKPNKRNMTEAGITNEDVPKSKKVKLNPTN